MLDPRGLYEFEGEIPELDRPVLIHALPGFIDAGSSARLATDHLLEVLENQVVVRFDHDQLVDYRSRRPSMVFRKDHLEQYAEPRIAIHAVRDAAGAQFLLLSGPEPDYQWNRFVSAVQQLVQHFGIRLSVGLQAVPMAVPHTRPIAVTGHATRPELVREPSRWEGDLHIPASIPTLIELRLGEAGYDAMGFAAHIPHYLSQLEFPDGARRLLEAVAAATDLALPSGELEVAGHDTARVIEEYVRGSEDIRRVVEVLEQQHDVMNGDGDSLAGVDLESLPSGEELGAQFERFLAQLGDSTPSADQLDTAQPDEKQPDTDQPSVDQFGTDRLDTDRLDTDRLDTDRLDKDRLDTDRLDTDQSGEDRSDKE
jgi:hypothetical protein